MTAPQLADAYDPGPVPDVDEPAPTLAERVRTLQARTAQAQDRAGWANVTDPEGVAELASATVELARINRELLAIVARLVTREEPR